MKTVDDILCKMRRYADEDAHTIGRDVLRRDIQNFADRIEAAVKSIEADRDNWRRQALDEDARANATCQDSLQVGDIAAKCKRDNDKPMTLDEAIAHAVGLVNDTPCGRAHKQLADWLKELREIKNSNAAAMRAALDEIRVAAMSDYEPDADNLIEKCNAALSAHPRNCDRFKPDEALSAYCEEKRIIQPLPLWYGNEFWAFINWLFDKSKGE